VKAGTQSEGKEDVMKLKCQKVMGLMTVAGMIVSIHAANAQEWGAVEPAEPEVQAQDPWAAEPAEPEVQAQDPWAAEPAEPEVQAQDPWAAEPAEPEVQAQDPWAAEPAETPATVADPAAEMQQIQMQLQQISMQLQQIQQQALQVQDVMDAFESYEAQLRATMVALSPESQGDIQAAEDLMDELRAVGDPSMLSPEEAQEFQEKYMEFQQTA